MAEPIKQWRVRCTTESAYVYIWADTQPTTCPNNAAHTIATDATAAVETRQSRNLILDAPIEPVVPGASKVIANDRPAIEIEANTTGYGAIQTIWPHEQNDAAKIVLQLSVVLKESGTGTIARLIARAKSDGAGDDSTGAWDDSQSLDVTVNHTIIGDVFRGSIELDASDFALGDAVALQIGREGAHANDTLSVALDIISVKGQAL
jgi:hypothetical protein